MSRYRRATAGRTFFFTVVTYQRRPILCDTMIRASLRRAIETVRLESPFSIDAWVMLPDHLHCIWTLPANDDDFSSRWMRIKRAVSRGCRHGYRDDDAVTVSMRKHAESTIWQRRFWEHQIRNDWDLERHMDYIHYNPVRHRLVDKVADWPYSTFHRYVREGLYADDWSSSAFEL